MKLSGGILDHVIVPVKAEISSPITVLPARLVFAGDADADATLTFTAKCDAPYSIQSVIASDPSISVHHEASNRDGEHYSVRRSAGDPIPDGGAQVEIMIVDSSSVEIAEPICRHLAVQQLYQ
ncbi:hypothetical protein [Rhodopirellula sp. P2]|uniref:hypothetical protein n=1 Tax=Rhodopirellula sp. P2 TaxID=2127060 RepID=UPI002368BFDE|nr:hypothetical protein [Rhodopirellula sp. P2]WDQ17875.1 hypothetical protein PSR62_04810 [Rhodopirellula sp. P2]